MNPLIVANDLVGVGKVALTTALPILASCEVETIPLPTMVLSSHTGGFQQIARLSDITYMEQAFQQWTTLDLNPCGLLTGYCPYPEQLDTLRRYAQFYRKRSRSMHNSR